MHVCPECGEGSPAAGSCTHDGTTLVAAGGDALLGQTIGTWRITRLLGEGGMGRVYKAVQPSIGARVAIKVITGSPTPDLVERFFAEARAVNLIRHEQIVNVLSLDRLPDGRPYIVMEYLDGAPLSAALRDRGSLPLGTLVQLATEVLDALAAAHARNIVHRDLKPDNIWVTAAGRAKVLDFGIAKLDPGEGGHGMTRTGTILGTPLYMSPEQAQAKPVDARSDLYAMGVILYQAATGRPPFTAEALFEILRLHVSEPPPPPRTLRPDLPAQLEAIILRALEKDPARRYASATEMGQALVATGPSLPADSWVSLRSTTPGYASAGSAVITPFGGRSATGAAPRSRWPLVAGVAGLVAAGAVVFAATRGGKPAAAQPLAGVVTPTPTPTPTPAPTPAPAPAPAPAPKPPASAPAPIVDPSRFDAFAYLREAQRLARLAIPDADLVQLIVPNVRPDGTADLSLDRTAMARYLYRSPATTQRGEGCLVEVSATAKGVEVERRADDACDLPIIGAPTCTLSDIWIDAINKRVPENILATLSFTTDAKGRHRWLFLTGNDADRWFDDGCEH